MTETETKRCKHGRLYPLRTCGPCIKKAEEDRRALIKHRNENLKKPADLNLKGFILFDREKRGPGRKPNKIPCITSSDSIIIFFNVAAIEIIDIKSFKFVNLYFDKDTKSIGIELLKEPSNYSFKLTFPKHRKACLFSAKSFLNYYTIKPFKQIELKKSDFKENFYVAQL